MNVCLATVHCKPRFIPLALLYLKACLVQQAGHAADTIDIAEFNPDVDQDTLVTRILSRDPEVIGLSCYVWNITKLLAAVRAIKQLRPSVRIVLGGPEVGPVAAAVLKAHPGVDVVVRSEGEQPFATLVDCWMKGGDDTAVAGISLRKAGAIVETPDAPVVKDLNVLASPHLTSYMDYTGRIVCIETQRGCVFRCNFCFYNKDYSIRNRRFDLDRVKEEILYWLARDVREIYLMDPVFNLNAERTKDICRFIAEHNLRRIPIHAEVWAEFIDEEMAHLMREAHFTFLEVGLQTTDSDVLATVERRLKLQKFLDGVGYLKQYELPFELQLIYGLPGETVQTFRKSLDFAASLDPPELEVFPLMVLPGTELWRKAEGFGLTFDPEPPYYVTSHFSMSAEDVQYGWKVHRALDYLSDAKTFRLLSREPGLTFSQVVDAWIAWDAERPDGGSRQEKVQQFLTDFCEERQIPSLFYQGFASVEFGAQAAAEGSG
jgi:radical SAM superfamily enzyme YgiQ (UPF0313 family)